MFSASKRLIIIDLILIFLIIKLPYINLEKQIETNNIIQKDIIEVEDIEEISSRSQEELRQVEEDIIEVTTISENCINLVKKYEGCKLTAYMNSGEEYYTIGYGHHRN